MGPWSEREIWPNLKANFISETEEATPTKIGAHAYLINAYLHEFFEPILINSIFSLPWMVPWIGLSRDPSSPMVQKENSANFTSYSN